MSDALKEKLRKIKRLAERGGEHERRTAAEMLERLLIKFNLTVEDLTNSEPRLCRFDCRRRQELTLLLHVVCKVKGVNQVAIKRHKEGPKSAVYLELTPAQQEEVDIQFKTYRRALRKESEKLLDAFVLVNQIFNPDQPPQKTQLTREEVEQLDATLRMA